MVKSRRAASRRQSSVNATTARRPSVSTSTRRVVTSNPRPSAIAAFGFALLLSASTAFAQGGAPLTLRPPIDPAQPLPYAPNPPPAAPNPAQAGSGAVPLHRWAAARATAATGPKIPTLLSMHARLPFR